MKGTSYRLRARSDTPRGHPVDWDYSIGLQRWLGIAAKRRGNLGHSTHQRTSSAYQNAHLPSAGCTAATEPRVCWPVPPPRAHKPSVSLRYALPSASRRDTLPVSTSTAPSKDSILKPPRLLVADLRLPQPANHSKPCPCLSLVNSWIYCARTTP